MVGLSSCLRVDYLVTDGILYVRVSFVTPRYRTVFVTVPFVVVGAFCMYYYIRQNGTSI